MSAPVSGLLDDVAYQHPFSRNPKVVQRPTQSGIDLPKTELPKTEPSQADPSHYFRSVD